MVARRLELWRPSTMDISRNTMVHPSLVTLLFIYLNRFKMIDTSEILCYTEPSYDGTWLYGELFAGVYKCNISHTDAIVSLQCHKIIVWEQIKIKCYKQSSNRGRCTFNKIKVIFVILSTKAYYTNAMQSLSSRWCVSIIFVDYFTTRLAVYIDIYAIFKYYAPNYDFCLFGLKQS